MEKIPRLNRDSYTLLGQAEVTNLWDNETAIEQVATLEAAGYRAISRVLYASGLKPMEALHTISDGPVRVCEGAIIGPYIIEGKVMRGFSLFQSPDGNAYSVANILGRCVRISDHRSQEFNYRWREQANIEPRLVKAIPILDSEIVRPSRDTTTPVDQVWSVLTNSRFRRGNLLAIQPYREYIQSFISAAVDRNEPIQIILPTLPFKDQNPLTTGQPVEMVDLGEHAFVAQMRNLVKSIRQVYEPGLQITLVSEGQVYRDLFTNATEEQVADYSRNVELLIEQYDVQDSVSIVDFADIIQRDENFPTHQRGVERLLRTRQSRRVIECLRALQRGMLVNCQLDEYTMENIEYYRHLAISEWPEDIRRYTLSAARKYASFIITAYQRQTLAREYPAALRATVHPKAAAQLPLHLVNNKSIIFPYNGVPVVKENDPYLRRSLRIVRLSQILASSGCYYRCHDEGGRTLYYIEKCT